MNTFVGVNFRNYDNMGLLNQRKHITEAITTFELLEEMKMTVLIDNKVLDDTSSLKLQEKKIYQSKNGILNNICNQTRPDTCFSINVLARQAQFPLFLISKEQRKHWYIYVMHRVSEYLLKMKRNFTR